VSSKPAAAHTDRVLAARVARKFVLESVLIRTSESNKAFYGAIGKLGKFRDVFKPDDDAAPKMTKIATASLGKDFLTVVPALITHWRNRIVHSSNAKLSKSEKALLQDNEEEIAKTYKALKVDCLLCHFEEGRPTLKDVSCLIAMSIKLARRIDADIYRDLSKDDLDAWLEHYGLIELINNVRSETKPEKVSSSIERLFKSRGPLLLEPYNKYYREQIPTA
jgi:hypothetical protein